MVSQSKTISVFSDGNVGISSISNEYVRLDENLTVPHDGTFIQLKHWDELGRGDNKNAYPEMFTPACGLITHDPDGRFYDYVELPESWQWFLWEFWKWASQDRLPIGKIESFYQKPGNERIFANTTPGSLTYVYVNMVEAHRAFTEDASPEAGNRDYVTKRNLGAKESYNWLCNPTGGALGKVVRDLGASFEIEALDLLHPPPTISYVVERPWLYFWCVQWGKYSGATRFPQIKVSNAVHGLPPAGIPSPLLSKGGTLRVLKKSCTILSNGSAWSPYRPK